MRQDALSQALGISNLAPAKPVKPTPKAVPKPPTGKPPKVDKAGR